MKWAVLALAVLIVGCDSSDFEATSINGSWTGSVDFGDSSGCSAVAGEPCLLLELTVSLRAGQDRPQGGVFVSGSGLFSYEVQSDTTITGNVQIVGENYADSGRIDIGDMVTHDGLFYLNFRLSPSTPAEVLTFTGEYRDSTLTGHVSGFGDPANLVMTRP